MGIGILVELWACGTFSSLYGCLDKYGRTEDVHTLHKKVRAASIERMSANSI